MEIDENIQHEKTSASIPRLDGEERRPKKNLHGDISQKLFMFSIADVKCAANLSMRSCLQSSAWLGDVSYSNLPESARSDVRCGFRDRQVRLHKSDSSSSSTSSITCKQRNQASNVFHILLLKWYI